MTCLPARAVLVLLLLAAVLSPGLAAPIHMSTADVRVPVPEKAAAVAEQWRAPMLARMQAASIRLLALEPARLQALQMANGQAAARASAGAAPVAKAWQVGIGREPGSESGHHLPAELDWEPVADGQVVRLDVISPGAAALRVGLALANAPDGTEIRVAGEVHPGHIHRVDGAQARQLLDGEGLYWTAATDGERQRIEVFVPQAQVDPELPASAVLAVRRVSHLLLAANAGGDPGKALGASGSCNIDVACRANLGQAFQRAKDAVAHMLYQVGGSAYVCTGTLLNDTGGTGRHWFYTAQHCIGTQAVANTLLTFWQYEAPSCGGSGAGPRRQMGGGATLHWAAADLDAALLELRGQLPAGIPVTRAGWNSAPLAANELVHAIHHPQGDRKKYSRGTHTGPLNASFGGAVVATSRVAWNQGTTEAGSSGSGLFTDAGDTFHFRGGLVGGQASCSATPAGNWDGYSRLDLVFPHIARYLVTGGDSQGPSRDYTGAWYVPDESGWGLLLHQYPDQLFATWFTFDNNGRRAWYSLLPQWTGTDTATGTVQRPSGPRWGPSFNPGQVAFAPAGEFSLVFVSANTARFTYHVDTVQRTVTLHRLGAP